MANLASTCFNALMKTFETSEGLPVFSTRDQNNYRYQMEQVITKYADDPGVMKAAAKDLITRIAHKKAKMNHTTIHDFHKEALRMETIENAKSSGNKAFEGAAAILEGSNKAFPGSKNSAEMIFNNTANRLKQGLKYDIFRGNLNRYGSGKYDIQIAEAMDDLWHGRDISRFETGIVDTAKAFNKVNSTAFKELRARGIHVEKLKGFVTHQTYDAGSIGPNKAGWIDRIREGGDWERVLGKNAAPKQVDKFIAEMLDGILHTGGGTGLGIQGRLKHRQFHWKDQASFIAHNKEFGYAETLGDSIVMSLDKVARDIAIYEKLGSKPEIALNSIAKTLDNPSEVKELMKMYEGIKGSHLVKGYKWYSKAAGVVRKMTAMAYLGKAAKNVILPDLSHAVINGARLGEKNIFVEAISNTVGFIEGVGMGALDRTGRAKLAKDLGLGIDDFFEYTNARMLEQGEVGTGLMAKAQKAYYMFNGLGIETNAMKYMTAKNEARTITAQLKKGISKEGMRYRQLKSYGITDGEMDVLTKYYKGDVIDFDSIRDMQIPEGVYNGMREDIFKHKLASKVTSVVSDMGEMHTGSPGNKELRQLGVIGSDVDSVSGVLVRAWAQFKAAPLKGWNDMMYNKNLSGSKAGEVYYLAQRIISATVGLYTTDYLYYKYVDTENEDRAILPEDLTAKHIADYMMRANAFGLWGDAIVSQYSSPYAKLTSFVAGPSVSLGEKILRQGASHIGSDEWSSITESDMRLLLNTNPVTTMMYTTGLKNAILEAFE